MKFKFFQISLISVCIAFWLIVSIAHNSSYYFSKSSRLSDIIVSVFPQGWGFFTKDPRNEYNYNLYSLNPDEKIYRQITYANSTLSSSYGFSKNNRRCFYEIGLLTDDIKVLDWINFKGLIFPIPEDSSTIVINTDGMNLSCILKDIDYLLVRTRTIPFAWSGKKQENNRPGEVVRFKIQ